MSEDGDNETALVPARARDFKMPNFGNKAEYLRNKLEEVYKTTQLNVKNHVEKETDQLVVRRSNAIADGDEQVLDDQKDFKQINARIVAHNKKVELQRKIKHMGINEALFRKDEMNEKLKLLNENAKYLQTEVLEEDDEDLQGSDRENISKRRNSNISNRRSVDAIRMLEDKLGLPISTKHQRIMNYKDKMHVSKEELAKSQENALNFVNKMKEKQLEIKEQKKKIRQMEQNKTKTILNEDSQRAKELEEEKKQKLLERIDKHKEQLEKEKENRQKREANWKAFKAKEKKTAYLHDQIEERYSKEIGKHIY